MSLLQPFPRPVGDVGLGAFSAEDPTVTLQDLLQLDVRVTWDEAVSVVEELCDAAQGLVMRPIPAAPDILLNANGTVTLRQSAGGVPDPVEAARRLAELLAGSVAPAPLRLFVSQAVSSGHYNSLTEFSDALAYYAKPGRQDRVKAVYQRASEQLMVHPSAESDAQRPKAAAVTKPPSATPPRQHQSRRQLALVGLITAGVVSMVMGIALYLWPSASSTSSAPPAATAESEPAVETPAAAPAARSGKPAAAAATRQASPAGSPAASPAVRTSSALDAAQMPLTGSRAASGYTGGSGGSRQGTRASAGSPASAPAAAAVETVPAGGAQPAAPRVASQVPQTRSDELAIDSAAAPESSSPIPIYSASDATVQPAVLSKPQILPPPFGVPGSGKPVRMELVISPTGTVERARFLEAPQRMADMMLLSSAKTWRFTPAMKDGQAVRYRTVLSWVGAP